MRAMHFITMPLMNSVKRVQERIVRRSFRACKGNLQADAFTGYDEAYAGGDVKEVACMAHCLAVFRLLGRHPGHVSPPW
jgi:hypothetical protein